MTYDEIIAIVANSKLDDWNIIVCAGFGSGPSYKSRFTFNESIDPFNSMNGVLFEESHHMYGCYKPNISISLAFGLTLNKDFLENWANNFPDPVASSHCIDVFYNNSLVDRFVYVSVDGGRANLPIPESAKKLLVNKTYAKIVRLTDRFNSEAGIFEDYLNRAGIKLEDDNNDL